MNQSYQHKKGPPKMVKDLKFGIDAHLRQSLLDITQIQNLNKIFIGRKTHYHIDKIEPETNNKLKQNNKNQQQQLEFLNHQFTLSPEENLQLIKRQRITNKMKDKLNQMFKQQQVRKYQLRKPVLHNMLEDFKQSFRVQQQPKFRQALKNSQKDLEHIKINSKKRISSQYVRTNTSFSRTKFLSITTSKPTVNKNYFPSFTDFVKGKYKIKQKAPVSIDISKIDNYFQTMMTEPVFSNYNHVSKKNSKDDYIRNLNNNRQTHTNTPLLSGLKTFNNQSPVFVETDTQQICSVIVCSKCDDEAKKNKFNFKFDATLVSNFRGNQHNVKNRSKSAVNPNLVFNRSQQSSKKIISSMQTYYNVKKQKNQQCDTIVEYMKKDRPLTSHIRRKNYQVIGSQHIPDVDKYRQKSQQERVKILEKNYDFYISLLKIFEHCKQEEIQTSLSILKKLKQLFESEYVLFKDDVNRICELSQGEKPDFGVRIIKQNLMQYAKKEANFSSQNQEEFQIL